MRKDVAIESFFFVAAIAYSQLFCELLGKCLLLSELQNAHMVRQVFFDYRFQRLNFGWQSLAWLFVHAVVMTIS